MNRSQCAGQSGFSIVEMMIGISLVAVAFVGLAPLTISSNHVAEAIGENEVARAAARAKLEELRTVPYSQLLTNYVDHSFTVDLNGDGKSDLRERSSRSAGTGTGGTGVSTPTIPVGSVVVDEVPGGDLVGEAVRIQVVLRWSSRQGTQEYRLHTIRARD